MSSHLHPPKHPLKRALDSTAGLPGTLVIVLLKLASLPWSRSRLGHLLRSFSLPSMSSHRLRTSLTVFGVALGVAVLVGVSVVSDSILHGVAHSIDAIAGKADLQIVTGSGGFDESALDAVRATPGVYKSTPVMEQTSSVRGPTGVRERFLVVGVDMLGSEDSYFRSYESDVLQQLRRNPLPFLNSPTNILLGRELATRLGVRLHDKVLVETATGQVEFEVWGFAEDRGSARSFAGAVGIMYYPAMQVAFARGHNIDHIDVAVEPGGDIDRLVVALQARLGPGFEVQRPSQRGRHIAEMLSALRTGLMTSSLVALLAGAFLAFNTITMSVVQRRRELGILRALGATRRELLWLLTLEGGLLAVVATSLGIVLGLVVSKSTLSAVSHVLNDVYLKHDVTDVHLDLPVVLVGVCLGIVCTTAAAALAGRAVAHIQPVHALTSGTGIAAGNPHGSFCRTDVAGLALFALSGALLMLPTVDGLPVAALFACLTLTLAARALMPRLLRLAHLVLAALVRLVPSVEARLAVENFPRDPARASNMASGLMAGIALAVGAATFVLSFMTSLDGWLEQTVTGDLLVTHNAALVGQTTPMSDTLRTGLAALDGVREVRAARTTDSTFDGKPVKLVAIDGVLSKSGVYIFTEGDEEQAQTALAKGGVLISDNFASLHHVHRGERIRLSTSAGNHEFPVAGVVVNYVSEGGTILMDRSTYVAHWRDTRVDSYELSLAESIRAATLREVILRRFGEEREIFVFTNSEFRSEVVKTVSRIFQLTRALELVALIVAVFGIITAALANVLDRVRELGVLRALGMRRVQVSNLVVMETVVVGAIGTVAGLGLGLALGYVSVVHVAPVQTGWFLPFRFPVASMTELSVIAVFVSAVAGWYPGRKAAGLVVREALDYQ